MRPAVPRRPRATDPEDERPRLSPAQLTAVGVMGLAIIGLIGFIGASILGGSDDIPLVAASVSVEPSVAASVTGTPGSTPAASATPTPQPDPATPLTGGAWASVVTNAVNVRAEPDLDAPILGRAEHGEIVYVVSGESVEADDLTWYRAVTDPGTAGWMAGHAAFTQFLAEDAPDRDLPWCAVPDAPAFQASPGTDAVGLAPELRVGGLPIDAAHLSVAGSAAVEIAWATQHDVCLDLEIARGQIRAARLEADLSGCGAPAIHPSGIGIVFGTGAVRPDGSVDRRAAQVHPALLGFLPMSASDPPNLEDVLRMAAGKQVDVCAEFSVAGGLTDTAVAMEGTAEACVEVGAIDASVAVIHASESHRLLLTPGSVVDERVQPFTFRWVRVSAKGGTDGAVQIDPVDATGCG